MNNQNIRHALSKIAWAYLLILLNFRINDLDLLPNWAGYLLIFLAIGQLSGELRNLPLLKPFCILLGIAAGVDWLALPLSGAELTGRFFLLSGPGPAGRRAGECPGAGPPPAGVPQH